MRLLKKLTLLLKKFDSNITQQSFAELFLKIVWCFVLMGDREATGRESEEEEERKIFFNKKKCFMRIKFV